MNVHNYILMEITKSDYNAITSSLRQLTKIVDSYAKKAWEQDKSRIGKNLLKKLNKKYESSLLK